MSSVDDGIYGILILILIVIIFRIIYYFIRESNRESNQTQPLLNLNV